MTTLRKRPNVDLISPGELAELGRDLAFAQRRIDTLDEEELALERKYKFLKSELRREREYLKRESARVIEAIIYQFKLSDVTYEDEVKKSPSCCEIGAIRPPTSALRIAFSATDAPATLSR